MIIKRSRAIAGKDLAAKDEKGVLHARNLHRGRYDFARLISSNPELAAFVFLNEYGDESINFADPAAVKALNRALLSEVYGIKQWDIPPQYLCPPIPGRADYVHYLADLLAVCNGGVIPRSGKVRVLDIGVGANCIYPLIGQRAYGWQFVGSDIDAIAIANAQRIVAANGLSGAIALRLQPAPASIFAGLLQPDERFDLTMCNPPFHASQAEANAGSLRKWKNLGKLKKPGKADAPALNFGGQGAELWCAGGEEAFVLRMIEESAQFGSICLWFTTLVSKAATLPAVYRALNKAGVHSHQTVEMAQGQKKSRFVAWTFLNEKQQQAWRKECWQ